MTTMLVAAQIRGVQNNHGVSANIIQRFSKQPQSVPTPTRGSHNSHGVSINTRQRFSGIDINQEYAPT